MRAVLNHPYLQGTQKGTVKVISPMPSLLHGGGGGGGGGGVWPYALLPFYLRVSGEHLQLSLCELPEAQDAVFERGLLWFKAKR